MAILGTDTFDITQVDPTLVRLAGVEPRRTALEDVPTPFLSEKVEPTDCTVDGPDGFTGFTALGPVMDGDVMVVTLTGYLKPQFGGTPIVGEDVVVIINKN